MALLKGDGVKVNVEYNNNNNRKILNIWGRLCLTACSLKPSPASTPYLIHCTVIYLLVLCVCVFTVGIGVGGNRKNGNNVIYIIKAFLSNIKIETGISILDIMYQIGFI